MDKNNALQEMADEIHQNAVDHGWWEEERSFPEIIALCHSELSEALEAYRASRPMLYFSCWRSNNKFCIPGDDCEYQNEGLCTRTDGERGKPGGIAVELSDCIIRILDYCGRAGIDIGEAICLKHEYNKRRPWRHGGKVV